MSADVDGQVSTHSSSTMLALASHPASFPTPKDAPAFARVPANNTQAGPLSGNTDGISAPGAPSVVEGFQFDDMGDALAAFSRGEFLMVMDDEGRENEGDLIIAADKITTEKMAWFIKHTSGYVCISLPQSRLDELQIPMMVPHNTDPNKTAYTHTVDYKYGTTTGISAHDRALTARMLASRDSRPEDFSRPGHMVPLRARPGGTLQRKGHTEAAIDLCRLTNQPLAGLLCEVVNDDEQGTMARRDDCRRFADKWGIKMVSVDMIANWRAAREGPASVPASESQDA